MPTGKSLYKINKQISKSKGVLHPKGRKFAKYNRAHLREAKLEKKKLLHLEKRENELQRELFFQEAVEPRVSATKKSFTIPEVKLFIEAYLSRFDEELDGLRALRRSGRPSTKRQDALEEKLKQEVAEYETGFKVPNLCVGENVESLIRWNGTIGGVNNIKFHYLAKNSEVEADSDMKI